MAALISFRSVLPNPIVFTTMLNILLEKRKHHFQIFTTGLQDVCGGANGWSSEGAAGEQLTSHSQGVGGDGG